MRSPSPVDRRSAAADPGGKSETGRSSLLRFAVVVAFAETAFFAVLVPLLPSISAEFALSPAAAGLLVAAYPAGILAGVLPSALLAGRSGGRTTARVGLGCIAIASLGFGAAQSPVALDLARFVQGLGAAAAWTGTLLWLLGLTAPDGRGAALGTTVGAAFAGSLLGPVLGAVAATQGRITLFAGISVVLAATCAWGGPRELEPAPDVRSGARLTWSAGLLPGVGLMVVVGFLGGGIDTLGPLLLSHRGAGPVAVAVCFLIAAAPQVVVSPVVGGLADRYGPVPTSGALLGSAPVFLLGAVLVGGLPATMLLFALAALAVGAMFSPVALLLTQTAGDDGAARALAVACITACWSLGAALGALVLGGVAARAGIDVGLATATLFCLATLVPLVLSRSPRSRRDSSAGR